jgi:uncharacterized protein
MTIQAVYIPHLLYFPSRTQTLIIDENISDLETLTPVRGEMTVRHGGTFLEVIIKAETIITFICDRCTQHYNQRLSLDQSEIIWLDKEADAPQKFPQEREVAWEDLSENLSPEGHFEVEKWIYEQLSLAFPLRRLCGNDCQPPLSNSPEIETNFDGRWSALEILKKQLSQ